MNTQYVKIYTDNDGVYEVSFTKKIKGLTNSKQSKLTSFGYYFWLVLFLFIIVCSLCYTITLYKQGNAPFINLFEIGILVVSAWRFNKARSGYRKMIGDDLLLTCFKEYDTGNYKQAIKALNKFRENSDYIGQELLGNLAYLHYRTGDERKAQNILLSIFERDQSIQANNIKVIAE